jgi:predicted methyltransferase
MTDWWLAGPGKSGMVNAGYTRGLRQERTMITMNRNVILALLTVMALMITACTSTEITSEEAIAEAMAGTNRTDTDRERDARSRPEVILGMLDLKPGDFAADIFGGGGYYAVLMANIVGADGEVILQNNTPYSRFVEKQNNERFGSNQVPNIRLLKSEVDDLKLSPGSLDAVLMVMSYHDLYFHAPERGWGNTDVQLFFSQIRAAMKPGGRLVIVDHSAADGSGKSAAQDIHRIDETFAKQVIESNGFRFVSSSDVLSNPEDDRTKMVFDKSIRGKTDRFILAFERQ